MRGENRNVLISTVKTAAFKDKLLIWTRMLNDNSLDTFPLTAKTRIIPSIIGNSKTLVSQKLDRYF